MQPASAEDAYENVLGLAGAHPRDSIDERVVGEVRSRTGRLLERPGSIPPVATSEAYPDEDGDGMDDRWEAENGADAQVFDAWDDPEGRGTANLDRFLDDLSDRLIGEDSIAL